MAYGRDAEPIRMGYLMDFRLPESVPPEYFADLTDPFKLVLEEGLAQGVIDRPIEIIYKEVEGLPKGSVKARSSMPTGSSSTRAACSSSGRRSRATRWPSSIPTA